MYFLSDIVKQLAYFFIVTEELHVGTKMTNAQLMIYETMRQKVR